jgi:hypothetical protein
VVWRELVLGIPPAFRSTRRIERKFAVEQVLLGVEVESRCNRPPTYKSTRAVRGEGLPAGKDGDPRRLFVFTGCIVSMTRRLLGLSALLPQSAQT